MKTLKWMLLAALLLPSLALAAGKARVMTTPPIRVQVQVNALGHVVDISPMQKLNEPFAGIVQHTLANWTFYPARINDKPVATTTWLSIELKAQMRDNGDAAVQVVYLGNGPDIELIPPRYPPDMVRDLREARIVVQATLGLDGHLSDARVVQALTTDGGRAREFVDSVMAAVSKAKGRPIVVDGQPVVSHIRCPVSFTLDRNGHPAGMPEDLKHAIDSVKYVKLEPAPEKDFSAAGDYTVALDSPVKPLSTPGG